jgi:hypothetical protein
MASRKIARRAAKPRPDRQSTKRSGMIRQSLRLDISEARLLRKAAGQKRPRLSIHAWMVDTLMSAAKRELGIVEESNS